MHKLTVTLKQHTPLIHFQHDQEGATLRASEVKPKLDKFILTKLGGDDGYEEGIRIAKTNGWLIGKGEHAALNYKMRIVSSCPIDVVMVVQPKKDSNRNQKRNELGDLLYTTQNYPDNMNSLIMGNMEGRIKSELLNFKLYKSVEIIIIPFLENIGELVRINISEFFVENNFGNRTSKGFGSYTVYKIDGEKNTHVPQGDWSLRFSLNCEDGEIREDLAYRDIFYVINRLWKSLKKYSDAPKNILSSVFLGRDSSLTNNEDRIPSPLFFKPIITSKEEDSWKVCILAILNQSVIDAAGSDIDEFYDLIDMAVKETSKFRDKSFENNYQITNVEIL